MTELTIFLMMIVLGGCFYFGFRYNFVFLYASAVIGTIVGLLILTQGIATQVGYSEISNATVVNGSTVTNLIGSFTFDYNDVLSQLLGLVLIIISWAFVYFKNNGQMVTGRGGEFL